MALIYRGPRRALNITPAQREQLQAVSAERARRIAQAVPETPAAEPLSLGITIMLDALPGGTIFDLLAKRNALSDHLEAAGVGQQWGAGSFANAVDLSFDFNVENDYAVDAVRDAAIAVGLDYQHIYFS